MIFKFSLQTALDVRLREEKIKMKELAEKLAIEQIIIKKMNTIREDTQKAELNLESRKHAGQLTIISIKALSDFKSKMTFDLADQQQQLELASEQVRLKQNLLIEASKRRKTLEILMEKEKKRVLAEIALRERKSMDEIAGNQFYQQQQSGSI